MQAPSPNDRLIVGVSGGADSVALLHLLHETSQDPARQLIVAHVNYGLRGRASDADERFVRGLAKGLGLDCRVLKTPARKKSSLQDRARRVRYSFFDRLARRHKAWGAAVAHHMDDQAETVLDRLLRGAGLKGLSGLRPLQALPFGAQGRPLRVWRPLLSFSKDDLKAYLRSRKAAWREDASNEKNSYRRNFIRNKVLPYLSRFNPNLKQTLARTGEVLAADEEFLDRIAEAVDRRLGGVRNRTRRSWVTRVFSPLPAALKRRLVRMAAEKLDPDARGLSFARIEEAVGVLAGHLPGPRDLGYRLQAQQDQGLSSLMISNKRRG